MKSKISIVFLCLIVFILNIKNVKAEELKYCFNIEREISITENTIYISDNILISYNNDSMIIETSNGDLLINDKYEKYSYINNQLYIISPNSVYLVNLSLLSYHNINLEQTNSDVYIDDYIYVVGDYNNNPKITILDYDLNILKEKVYEGKGIGRFTKIIKVKGLLVGIIEKDAFYDSEYFYKVGNKDDYKSVILTLSNSLDIQDIYYFNEYETKEVVNSLCIDDNINVVLKAGHKSYFYEFDYSLSLLTRRCIDVDNNQIYFINNTKNVDLFCINSLEQFKLAIIDKEELKDIYVHIGNVNNFGLTEGGFYYTSEGKIYVISEYHIDYINTLILDKITYDEKNMNHFKVTSFFEDLTFNLVSTNPFHQHMMSGEYIAKYVSKNKFGSNIFIETPLEVRDFVNIIDGGVYNINTKLFFFGSAFLNNKQINNGHTLDEAGDYELVIKDVNNNEKIYKFNVKDDYYKDNDNYVIEVDYIVQKSSDINVVLILEQNVEEVNKLIINDQEYFEYTLDNNTLSINIDGSNKWGYHELVINKIVVDKQEISINKRFTILTKKDMPNINLYTDVNNDEYIINLDIVDKDLSIVDIYEENNIYYVSYELGDGILKKEYLFEIVGNNIDVTKEFDENKMRFKIKRNDNLEKIIINEKNIYKKINNSINQNIILVTIISSIIVLIITTFTLIFKYIKRRKTNRI